MHDIYIYISLSHYIYIYREREREGDLFTYTIYIYMLIYAHICNEAYNASPGGFASPWGSLLPHCSRGARNGPAELCPTSQGEY